MSLIEVCVMQNHEHRRSSFFPHQQPQLDVSSLSQGIFMPAKTAAFCPNVCYTKFLHHWQAMTLGFAAAILSLGDLTRELLYMQSQVANQYVMF